MTDKNNYEWVPFMVLLCTLAFLSWAWSVASKKGVVTEPVVVQGLSGVGTGSLIRDDEGNPKYVVTSFHSLGIPLSYELEIEGLGKRRMMMMRDAIVLKVSEE